MRSVVTVLGLAGLAAVASADFSYSDFSSTSGLALNGTASQVGNVVRLTPLGTGNAGNMWRTNQEAVGSGFTTTFDFRCFDGSGADGIAFCAQELGASQIGSGGGSNAMSDIPNAVGINFQSFWNEIQFFVDGAVLDTASVTDLHRDLPHQAEITYDGSTHDWTVRIDGTQVYSYNYDLTTTLTSGSAYVGLGAGTGAADDNNDVHAWSYSSVPEPTSLMAVGLFAASLMRHRKR